MTVMTKKTLKTFWEVTLPDFFLPHYINGWEMVKSHVAAYINLVFLTFLVMGVLYAFNYRVSVEKIVQVVSPIPGK
jgi:hypothetical protein